MSEPTERVTETTNIFEAESGAATGKTGFAPTLASSLCSAAPAQLRPGGSFGDFLILRVLGEGSFAKVYLAHDVALERRVALKVSERRGLGEGQALADLDHEHIVRVYAQFTDAPTGKHCLCLQYVPGDTLAGVIERLHCDKRPPQLGQEILDAIAVEASDEVPFDLAGLRNRQTLASCGFHEAVCRIGMQMAEALQFAHGRGILHCDIKPANVLINPYGRPLLADFNISVAAEQTRPGKGVGGTLLYMAPEQLALFLRDGADLRLDERCDIYSLGIVLFELLTGHLPFEPTNRETDREFARELHRLQRAFAPDVSWEKERFPPVLERVLRRCLDPDRDKRYASAGKLAQALANAFDLLTIEKALPAGGRPTRWTKRRPIGMLLAVAFLPQAVGSAVNIAYNAVEIRLNAPQHEAFNETVIAYNLIAYPICLLILVSLVMPVIRGLRKLPASGALSGDEVDFLRSKVLRLGTWANVIALMGWLPGGVVFPLCIDMLAGPLPWQVYAQFVLSFTLSGLIALVYSHLGIQFVVLRGFYPRLGNADTRDPASVRAELSRASRWFVVFQCLAAMVPLVGAGLVVFFAGEMTLSFRLLVTSLMLLGGLGVIIAMAAARQLIRLVRILDGENGA